MDLLQFPKKIILEKYILIELKRLLRIDFQMIFMV